MTPVEQAELAAQEAVRRVYVELAHAAALPLSAVSEYLEELAALYALDVRRCGAWALTLEQSLAEKCPDRVKQALTHLAHSVAILEALEADDD